MSLVSDSDTPCALGATRTPHGHTAASTDTGVPYLSQLHTPHSILLHIYNVSLSNRGKLNRGQQGECRECIVLGTQKEVVSTHFEVPGLRLTHHFISSLPTFVSIFIHPCPLSLAALGATRTDLHDQTARKKEKKDTLRSDVVGESNSQRSTVTHVKALMTGARQFGGTVDMRVMQRRVETAMHDKVSSPSRATRYWLRVRTWYQKEILHNFTCVSLL